jgi:hypothetical protein
MEHAEDITKAPDVSFKDVHPTRTAGGSVPGKEPNFIRCKQCGFLFEPDKHPKGSGYGNETSEAITTIGGATANARDPIVGAGCPFCSASEYD